MELQTFITTNYDTFIEDILTSNGKASISYSYSDISHAIKEHLDKPGVLHLHGIIRRNEPILVSKEHINNRLLSGNIFIDSLKILIHKRSLLFLGYSLSDPHIGNLLENMRAVLVSENIKHYMVASMDEVVANNYRNSMNIHVIQIPSHEGNPNGLIDVINEINKHIDNNTSILLHNYAKRMPTNSKVGYSFNNSNLRDLMGSLSALTHFQMVDTEKDAVLYAITKIGLSIIGKENRTFTLHLRVGNHAIVVAGTGKNFTDRSAPKVMRLSEGLIGRVYRDKIKSYIADNVDDEPDYFEANPDTKSEIIVSVFDVRDDIIGFLNVESIKMKDFSETDDIILRFIASFISVTLQNKRMYDSLDILQNISSKFIAEKNTVLNVNPTRLIDMLLETIASLLGIDMAALFIESASIYEQYDPEYRYSCDKIMADEMLGQVMSANSDTFHTDEGGVNCAANDKVAMATCLQTLRDGRRVILLLSSNDIYYDFHEPKKNVIQICSKYLRDCIESLQKEKHVSKKAKVLNLSNSIYHAMHKSSTLRSAMYDIATPIAKEMGAGWCFIYLKNYQKALLEYPDEPFKDVYYLFATSRGFNREELDKKSYLPTEGLTGSVARLNKPVREDYVFGSDLYSEANRNVFKHRGIDYTSFLGVPIRLKCPYMESLTQEISSKFMDVAGIIVLGKKRESLSDERVFSQSDAEGLLKIGNIIGRYISEIHNSRYNQSYDIHLTFVEKAAAELVECRNESQIWDSIIPLVRSYLGERYFAIYKLDKNHILRMVAPSEYVNMAPPAFGIGSGLTGRILSDEHQGRLGFKPSHGQGNIIFTSDFSMGLPECRDFWKNLIGTEERYFAGVPILHPDEGIYGAITVNGKRSKYFDPLLYRSVNIKSISSLASQISLALGKIGVPKLTEQ